MAQVILDHVSKSFADGFLAVNDISLTVNDGEFLVLLGPSGCGKTTTLRLIAGLETPTAGRIQIGNREVTDVWPQDRDIAMVFQNYALYPHLTVEANLGFGLQMRYGGNVVRRAWRRLWQPELAKKAAEIRPQIAERVIQAAEMLGIRSLLSRYPRQLSGGERQRVALGRALVRQPAVFLLDEPLSNLDARLRAETRRELRQLHAKLRQTIIHVTHDQMEALTLADRIAVMNKGQVQHLGTPAEVYDNPRNLFVAQFLGNPPMNLMPGVLRSAETGFIFSGSGWELPLAPNASSSRLQADHASGMPEGPGTGSKGGSAAPHGFGSLPALRAWTPLLGKSVQLGIRAEHVFLAESDDRPECASQVIKARVADIERTGEADIVQFRLLANSPGSANTRLPETLISGRLKAHSRVVVGTEADLVLDLSRVHLFDAETGLHVNDNC